MRLKTSEQEHMQSLGPKWHRALAAASMVVRSSPKLIGLDKIREPLAICAALNASGSPDHEGFVVPKAAGVPMQEMQDIVDATFADAVKAAKETLRENTDA